MEKEFYEWIKSYPFPLNDLEVLPSTIRTRRHARRIGKPCVAGFPCLVSSPWGATRKRRRTLGKGRHKRTLSVRCRRRIPLLGSAPRAFRASGRSLRTNRLTYPMQPQFPCAFPRSSPAWRAIRAVISRGSGFRREIRLDIPRVLAYNINVDSVE